MGASGLISSTRTIEITATLAKTVKIPLAADALAYWDAKQHNFVVEPDTVGLIVGASSADLKLDRKLKVGAKR